MCPMHHPLPSDDTIAEAARKISHETVTDEDIEASMPCWRMFARAILDASARVTADQPWDDGEPEPAP